MLTTSKYIMHGGSTRCAFCNKPFCFRDGYVELWRTAKGEHFCSEFCADDAEEAQFRVRHTASSSGATAGIQPNHRLLNPRARADPAAATISLVLAESRLPNSCPEAMETRPSIPTFHVDL